MSDKSDISQFSEAMASALTDLERIEFEFSIEEPQAKRIEGRFIGFLKDRGEQPN